MVRLPRADLICGPEVCLTSPGQDEIRHDQPWGLVGGDGVAQAHLLLLDSSRVIPLAKQGGSSLSLPATVRVASVLHCNGFTPTSNIRQHFPSLIYENDIFCNSVDTSRSMDPGGDLRFWQNLPAPNETEEWATFSGNRHFGPRKFQLVGLVPVSSWALVFWFRSWGCFEVGRSNEW